MAARPMVVPTTAYPRAYNVVGEHITVLAGGRQTGGYEIFLQEGPEGSGPPPHAHPWDESFYVLRGDVDFGIDEQALVASPGTLVHLPAGTLHWFRFRSGGGQMLSLTSREGASHMFEQLDREIAPEAPDLPRLIDIVGQHEVTVRVPVPA